MRFPDKPMSDKSDVSVKGAQNLYLLSSIIKRHHSTCATFGVFSLHPQHAPNLRTAEKMTYRYAYILQPPNNNYLNLI